MIQRLRFYGLASALLAGSAWAQAPAVMLPEIELPTAPPTAAVPADAPMPVLPPEAAGVPLLPATPAPDAGAAGTSAPVATEQAYSFGNAKHSLLFTAEQIERMKQSLRAFENIRRGDAPVQGDVTVIEEMPPVKAPASEPSTYPTYYLSSIVYHTDKDWTIWLNNARITPKTNNGELRVVSVKPGHAWFSWEPDYIQAVIDRADQKNFPQVDKLTHRLAVDKESVTVDRQKGAVTFALRPNQTFSTGHFRTFEGRVNPPGMSDAAPATATMPPDMPGGIQNMMPPDAAQTIDGLLGGAAAPLPAMAPPMPPQGMNPPMPSAVPPDMNALINSQRRPLPGALPPGMPMPPAP